MATRRSEGRVVVADIAEAEQLGLRGLVVKPETVELLGRVLHAELSRPSPE